MFAGIIALAAFVAVCNAGAVAIYPEAHATSYLGGYNGYLAAPYANGLEQGIVYGHGLEGHEGDHYAYPKYKYKYGVSDPHTGDHKSQEEYRDGDVVKGHYTVADPDGTLRVVRYTADDHNGFNAVVEKHGQSVHPEPIHPAPIVVERPIVQKILVEKPVYGGYDHGYGHGYGRGYGADHGHYGY